MSTINTANIQVGQSVTSANNITLNTDASGNLIINKGAPGALTEISRINNSGMIDATKVAFTPTGGIAATTVQGAIAEVVTDLSASSGASLVGYLPSGTGAVATTVQGKLREFVSVKDFGAKGDWNGATGTDNTATIQTALNSGAKYIEIPKDGVYAWLGIITIPSGVTLWGGSIRALSVSSQIQLTNSSSTLDGTTVTGTLNDAQYSNAVNGVAGYFSATSVLTDASFVPVGTLGAGKISGNLVTLGLFSDTGSSTTRVLSSKIPLDVGKRYVIDIQKDFVSAGYVASEVKFRAYDAGGALIVGNSSITVDAAGIYQYILPTSYSLGNYLWLDGASSIEVSFAVTRVPLQVAGNTCVFDASKIQIYSLINDFASLGKTSYDNGFCIVLGGTNNTVKNCTAKNILPTAIEANNSTGAKILNNTVYNCGAGINATTTTDTLIFNNHVEAYFGGFGQRAYRWKAFGGIDNPGLSVIGNVGNGYFWGYEMINSASLMPNIECVIKGNSSDSISACYSFSGYKDSVISDNTGIVGQLGNYLLEFPQTNMGCEVSNNTLNSFCQHRNTIGISGVGAFIANSRNKITNNTIRSALGIIATLGGSATVDSYNGTVVSGNSISYTATGIFSNIGGITVSNNSVICEDVGSNDVFGARAALNINAGSYLYEALVFNNSIRALDSYAIYGTSIRWYGIRNNTIKLDSNVFPGISLVPHAYAPMIFNCVNNTFGAPGLSAQNLIEVTGSYYAGSTYTITNNLKSTGTGSGDVFAGVNVPFLSQNNPNIIRGRDVLTYSGTTSVVANAFSFSVDSVKNGAYAVEMNVNNGDGNHTVMSNYVLLVGGGGVNNFKTFTLAQTSTCGTIVATAILSVSGSNIICSGTTTGSPATLYYTITMSPITR